MGLQSKLRSGGGYLNNVTATLTDINWMVGDTSKIKQGKNKGQDFTPLLLVPEFQQDGTEDSKPQRLLVGNAEKLTFEISDDGKVIEFSEGGCFLNSEAGIFLNSCEKPEEGDLQVTEFGDDDNKNLIDVSALVGTRMRVIRPVNSDRPQQKGKDGKMYDAKDLKCAEIFEIGGSQDTPTPTLTTKGKAAHGKPNGKVVEDDPADSPEDIAKIALLRYLEADKNHILPINKLKTKVSTDKVFTKDLKLSKQIIALLEDTDFLKSVEEVEYNGKKGTVMLPEDVEVSVEA
jgi:hypothetical protein